MKKIFNGRRNQTVTKQKKKLISQQKQEERKKEIDGFMKKEESLKVSLPKARILPKTNFIS